jgi:diaminohydroxyphosphoribosylaminopyrimidine deaminase/5-amino-6-(5-phosphoribosylamino)uracil reductase
MGDIFMRRCLELARLSEGFVAPNPMVGAALVHEGRIIGESRHRFYGAPHAEPEAIASVTEAERALLPQSTLYVNLEPCCHYGKTPPCTESIIAAGIPRVVIACADPFPAVNGSGVTRLREAGVEVTIGVLEAEARELNKFFFTFYEKRRPYIILKWAESADGFIDASRTDANTPPARISNELTRIVDHHWRAQAQALMVGTNTVMLDNPQLTVRCRHGKNPVRITFDRNSRLDSRYAIFDEQATTIVFVPEIKSRFYGDKTVLVETNFDEKIEETVLHVLYERQIQSLIVEGGTKLIESFLKKDLWDEARIFKSPRALLSGVRAPHIGNAPTSTELIGDNKLMVINRQQ